MEDKKNYLLNYLIKRTEIFILAVNQGHCHPRIVAALKDQVVINKFTYFVIIGYYRIGSIQIMRNTLGAGPVSPNNTRGKGV